jgi:Lrp/AsnC family transcriptional regulator for asnA, asnC and gidA
MEKIDNLDRKILEIVMHNARIPSKIVAAECGVSEQQCTSAYSA